MIHSLLLLLFFVQIGDVSQCEYTRVVNKLESRLNFDETCFGEDIRPEGLDESDVGSGAKGRYQKRVGKSGLHTGQLIPNELSGVPRGLQE
jgi:hypothetical protein